MAISWNDNCDQGTDGENEICSVIQQGFDEMYGQNELTQSNQGNQLVAIESNGTSLGEAVVGISDNGTTLNSVLDNANHISFYLFIVIVFTVVYIIGKWLFRLIQDVVLGW